MDETLTTFLGNFLKILIFILQESAMLIVLFSGWITELKRIVGREKGCKKSCLSSILTSTVRVLILQKSKQKRQT